MGTLIFTSQGVNLGAASASFTVTHGLGVVPDFVTLIMASYLTVTAIPVVLASTSQIVVLACTMANAVANLKVEKFNSIIA